jgi:roadblock/LC7 domain-containing protein
MVEVGGTIRRWTDLSSNGNDAVQATTAYAPLYTAVGIGGLPSATFTGPITFLAIPDSASMQWGTDDFVVLTVARSSAKTASEGMLYAKVGPYPYYGVNLYINADKPVPTTLAAAQVSGAVYVVSEPPPSTFVDSTVHLLSARRSGATLEIRVDGAVSASMTTASVAAVDVSAVGWQAVIGQNGYAPTYEFQQVHGDVAETLGVRGSVTDAELAELEQYLKTRYAIP